MKSKLLALGVLYLISLFILAIVTFITNSFKLLGVYIFASQLWIGLNLLHIRGWVEKLPNKKVNLTIGTIVAFIFLSLVIYFSH